MNPFKEIISAVNFYADRVAEMNVPGTVMYYVISLCLLAFFSPTDGSVHLKEIISLGNIWSLTIFRSSQTDLKK